MKQCGEQDTKSRLIYLVVWLSQENEHKLEGNTSEIILGHQREFPDILVDQAHLALREWLGNLLTLVPKLNCSSRSSLLFFQASCNVWLHIRMPPSPRDNIPPSILNCNILVESSPEIRTCTIDQQSQNEIIRPIIIPRRRPPGIGLQTSRVQRQADYAR